MTTKGPGPSDPSGLDYSLAEHQRIEVPAYPAPQDRGKAHLDELADTGLFAKVRPSR